jgi:hypothetical protein
MSYNNSYINTQDQDKAKGDNKKMCSKMVINHAQTWN